MNTIELRDSQGRELAALCRSMDYPVQVYYGDSIMRIVAKGSPEDFQAIVDLAGEVS